eukprot:CAMPEP_0175727140 /NCGR_PEP_ID=MMETSP0097-20121207/48626_1 /TAXON_ID=311494 /ORGANISM="Alexandrium monilatum, Strain CCMP3105" /LENGTH=222 /DNA_ID=CAMNT_0017034945 /DNA_START=11 /DNA_END=677 /DNA_ORIENTATION=-
MALRPPRPQALGESDAGLPCAVAADPPAPLQRQQQQQQQPQTAVGALSDTAAMAVEQAPAPEDLPQVLAFAGGRRAGSAAAVAVAAPAVATATAHAAVSAAVDARPMGASATGVSADLPAGHPGSGFSSGSYIFEVPLVRPPGATLGLLVMPVESGRLGGLWVVEPSGPPGSDVRPGDCIISVNGVASNFPVAVMREELCTREELRLIVRRASDGLQPTTAA